MQFSLTFDLEKIMQQILWQHVSEHKEDNRAPGNSQYGFTKGKWWLTMMLPSVMISGSDGPSDAEMGSIARQGQQELTVPSRT